MKRALAIALCLSLPILRAAQAQPDLLGDAGGFPLGVADTVFLSGNETTRPYVILNEMSLHPGAMVTPAAMEYDRRRIYSLGLFTRVDIQFDSLGGKRYLLVDVNERWYFFPVPILGFRDGDPNRFYFGGGLVHNNLGGRNQKLFASLVLGYDPSAGLSFLEPMIDPESRLSLGAGASFSRVSNKSTASGDFTNNVYDLHGSLGKRFGLFTTAGLTLGYRVVAVSSYSPGRTVSPTGKDAFVYATASFSYDTRDLIEYPMSGLYGNLQVTKFGAGESLVNYLRYGTDIRLFVPLFSGLSLAGRAAGSLVSGGTIPLYARAYFGYGERIRGHFHEVYEGEDLLNGSVEIRWAVLPAFTMVMRELPVPMEFKVWRFGITLSAFADAGAVWFRQDGLQLSDFRHGQGLGINFLLPYSYVARIEYAWNEQWRGQWILDLRGSF